MCVTGPVYAEDPLVLERGALKIHSSDVQNMIEAQIPPQHRSNVVSSDARIRQMISNLFIVRVLAAEARERGMAAQEAWNLAFQEDRLLAAKLLDTLQDAPPLPDFEAAAAEAYKANPTRFVEPAQVHVQHILVGVGKRTDKEAAALAKKVWNELRTGKTSFEELAAKYSDDAGSKDKGGDVGFFSKGKMVPEFEVAAFSLQKAGELAGPVKTQFGYHIIRFVERKEESLKPFETVKANLVEEERTRLRKERRDKETERVRSLEGVTVHDEALGQLLAGIKARYAAGAAGAAGRTGVQEGAAAAVTQ